MSNSGYIKDDFLLTSKSAQILYNDFAVSLPIIDFHNHLSAEDIASNRKFETITQLWIEGDHYKWRAMRANGIKEKYCTGDVSDREKFNAWASTVPSTIRNPLYHWTHLELFRYFGINELLSEKNADRIYDTCNELLKDDSFRVHGLLKKMNVEVLCTTDNPIDTLAFHTKHNAEINTFKIYPTFRPDQALDIRNSRTFNVLLNAFEVRFNTTITNFESYKLVLRKSHDYFASIGACVSDHGLSKIPNIESTSNELESIFSKVRKGINVSEIEIEKFATATLTYVALLNHEKDWVQQFHIGAIRNNRSSIFNSLGPDKGFDSIGDEKHAERLSNFLDRLDASNKLTKTILYNLNSADSEVFAAMAANFNDGSIKGKMQYGAGWWFLDQKNGIINQLNTVSNFGLLSNFVGMVTDSRSFLSFPRHEYFRRILCSVLGNEIESGELPMDYNLIGGMVKNICYSNAKKYFKF